MLCRTRTINNNVHSKQIMLFFKIKTIYFYKLAGPATTACPTRRWRSPPPPPRRTRRGARSRTGPRTRIPSGRRGASRALRPDADPPGCRKSPLGGLRRREREEKKMSSTIGTFFMSMSLLFQQHWISKFVLPLMYTCFVPNICSKRARAFSGALQ